MSLRKILVFSVVAVLLGLIGYASFLYYKLKRDYNLCEFIPANADAVVYVNSEVAIEQFFINNQLPKFKNKPWKKIPYFKHMESPEDLGFDYFSNAALVNLVDIYYLILPLKDADDFSDFIKGSDSKLYSPVAEKSGMNHCRTLGLPLSLYWNDDLLYVVFNRQPEQAIPDNIFKVSKANSFAQTSSFLKAVDDEALLWFYRKGKKGDETGGKDIEGKLAINGGLNLTLSYLGESSHHPGDIFASHWFDQAQFFTDSKAHHQISREFFNFCKLSMGNVNVPYETLGNCRNLLRYEGKRETFKTFVSYEYDDEFNKIKKEVIERDTVQAYTLLSECTGKTSVYANHSSADSSLPSNIPADVHAILSANQDFFKPFIPINLNYQLKLVQQEMNGEQVLFIQIKADNWRGFLRREIENRQ